MHAPLFWKEKTTLSTLLLPFATLYGFIARCRQNGKSQRATVPVICIGNAVAGGAGKTPVALALGGLLKARGVRVHYLSRGYKGRLAGPVLVDVAQHSALDVGDEPLLLAQMLPTWVARDRVAGAKAAAAAGAELILMDDGFQNPSLHKDKSLLVIDGAYGFGNERLMPSGPLREPIVPAMERASAVLLIGGDTHNVLKYMPAGKTLLRASIQPTAAGHALKDKAVVAFAGIARPRKFYRTLQSLGCTIKKMVAYPDHYVFTARDLEFLRGKAREFEATLVTTTKDYVRLPADMRAEVTAVPVEAVFEDSAALLQVIVP